MAGYGSILRDPRYPRLVERYCSSALQFAVEVVGIIPSEDQIDLLNAVSPANSKTTVVSGTGTGKTLAFGVIALWHMICFPTNIDDEQKKIGSNTYIAAPRIQQVADGVWKEMNDARLGIANGPFAWLIVYFTINKTTAYMNAHESTWFINQVAMQQGQSIGVAGKHRYWQLVIVDEAAGVSDDHFNVIDGTQTQGGNRTILASQGVRNTGKFYETHHGLSIENGSSWKALRFSSEDSPFVTAQWIKDRETECGGRHTVEYQIRVLGLFAEDSTKNLLTRGEIEQAFEYRKIINDDEPYGLFVLCDVGMGEYRDDSVAVVAKVIGSGDLGENARRVEYLEIPICTNEKNEIDFAGDVVNLFGKLSNATLYVDNGGVGATVNKLIERSGVPVQRVDWGKPCFMKEYKNRFYNLRACAMVLFRNAIREGRAILPQNLTHAMREKILKQGSRLPYHYVEAGGLRYIMDKKEDMAKDGIKSPDIFDAMSFAFLEGANYTPSEDAGKITYLLNHEDSVAKALDKLSDVE